MTKRTRETVSSILSLFVSLVLITSCSGDGDETRKELREGEGRVALESYVQNAKVCLDKNHNSRCEEFEPSTYSDENGIYDVSALNVSEKDLAEFGLLAEITSNSLKVSDNSNLNRYVLAAIPGKPEFISPFTTIVMVEAGKKNVANIENALAIFSEAFEFSSKETLFEDYVISDKASVSKKAVLISNIQNSELRNMYDNIELNLTPELVRVNETILENASKINAMAGFVPGSSNNGTNDTALNYRSLTNVPFIQGMDFGTGYNKINSEVLTAAQCIESDLSSFDLANMEEEEVEPFWSDKQKIGNIVVQRTAERNEVAYYFNVVESAEDLYSILNIDAKMELEIGDFTGSLEGGFLKEVSEETLSVFALFSIDAKLADFKVVNPKLKDTIATDYFLSGMFSDPDGEGGEPFTPEPFRQKCGDHFLNVITTGGTYYGLVKIDTQSMQEKMEIEARLKVTYADKFELQGQVDYQMKELFKNYNATIMTATKGVPGSLTRVSSFGELKHDVDVFYKNLADNAGYSQVKPDLDAMSPCNTNPCVLDPFAKKPSAPGADDGYTCIPFSDTKYACECEQGYVFDMDMGKCEKIVTPCSPNPCNAKNYAYKNSCEAVGVSNYTCECNDGYGWDYTLQQCVQRSGDEHKEEETPTLFRSTKPSDITEKKSPILLMSLTTETEQIANTDYRKAVYQVKFEDYEQATFLGVQGGMSRAEINALKKLQRDKEIMDTLVDLYMRYDYVERMVKIMLAFPESFVGVIERDRELRETTLRDLREYKAVVKSYAKSCARKIGRTCPLVANHNQNIIKEMIDHAIANDEYKYDKVVWFDEGQEQDADPENDRTSSQAFSNPAGTLTTIEFELATLQVPEKMIASLPMGRIVYPKTCAQRKKLYATNKKSGIYSLFMGGDKNKPYLIYCDDMHLSCEEQYKLTGEDGMDSPTNADDSYWCGPKEYLILRNASPLPETPEDMAGFTPRYNFSRYSGYGAKGYLAHVRVIDLDSCTAGPGCTCPEGGKSVRYGVDEDGNGLLDVSEESIKNICNETVVDGEEATFFKAIVETEEVTDVDECAAGGYKIRYGLSTDERLDDNEVTSNLEPICSRELDDSFADNIDKSDKKDLLTTYYKLRVLVNHNHLAVIPDQSRHLKWVGEGPYGITSSVARYGSTKACGLNKQWVEYSDGSQGWGTRESANINIEGTPFIIRSDVRFKTDKQFDVEPIGATWETADRLAVKRGGHLPIIRDYEDLEKYSTITNVAELGSTWTGLRQNANMEFSWRTGGEAYSGIPYDYTDPMHNYYSVAGEAMALEYVVDGIKDVCMALHQGPNPVTTYRFAPANPDKPFDSYDAISRAVGEDEFRYIEHYCKKENIRLMTGYETIEDMMPYIVEYKNLSTLVLDTTYQFEAEFEYRFGEGSVEIPASKDVNGNTTSWKKAADLSSVNYIVKDGEIYYIVEKVGTPPDYYAVGTTESFLISDPAISPVIVQAGRLKGEPFEVLQGEYAVIGGSTYYRIFSTEKSDYRLYRRVRQNVDLKLSNKLDDGACGTLRPVNDLILTYDQELADHIEVIEKLDGKTSDNN